MRLTVLAVRRNSPSSGRSSISRAIVCDRSPLATAPITRAVSLVGWTRSPISALTESMVPAQEPLKLPSEARCLILPSLPTTRLMRSSSSVILSSWSITSLNVSPTLPLRPTQVAGSRTVKSPCRSAVSAAKQGLDIDLAIIGHIRTSTGTIFSIDMECSPSSKSAKDGVLPPRKADPTCQGRERMRMLARRPTWPFGNQQHVPNPPDLLRVAGSRHYSCTYRANIHRPDVDHPLANTRKVWLCQ